MQDYDKEIPPHKIHSPLGNSITDMPLHYATEDKDHLKELEFYKNLAKAASLATQNNNNNNNSNNNNNNLINNEKSPLPHHPTTANTTTATYLQNNTGNNNQLPSPASSPQPMQIDTEIHHTILDEDDNLNTSLHKRIDEDVHILTDNDAEMLEPPTDQAKASALAAAAAAAQAHLNGTSEYISKSNFI